jgi:acetate kinase
MSDAILVVNAGSSSIKFSLFLAQGDALDLLLGGQIESLYTVPRFKARVPVWVIPTNEELMIARQTRRLLNPIS